MYTVTGREMIIYEISEDQSRWIRFGSPISLLEFVIHLLGPREILLVRHVQAWFDRAYLTYKSEFIHVKYSKY